MPLAFHAPPHLREEAGLLEKQYSGLMDGEVFATSGSTGAPKWIVHSREGLDWCTAAFNRHFGITPDDRASRALPVFHVGGFMIGERARAGGHAVIPFEEKWNPTRFAAHLLENGITLVSLVPTQLHDLVANRLSPPASLRLALLGGGALAEALATEARALGWPVVASYGMTETAGVIAATGFDDFALRPLDGWELRTNSDGLLEISGPGLFTGVIDKDGFHPREHDWFTTTDRATIDGTALTIEGRADEQIKILGELVNLARLRADFAAHLDRPATILPLPHPRRGHVLVPVIEGEDGEELRQAASSFESDLPGFCRMESSVFIPVIPRSSLGKIDFQTLLKKIPHSQD